MAGRVAITKTIGFVFGGVLFFLLPALGADFGTLFGLGLWLLYMLMAVMIGMMGMFKRHPILNFPVNFWIRGGIAGFLFHLLLILLAYSQVESILTLEAFAWTGFTSPWWILVDGVIYGIIIGWFATKFAGEGDLPIR